jgi:hypothetical protein
LHFIPIFYKVTLNIFVNFLQSGETEDMPRGDMILALKWQPKTESTGNLSVLIKEAKDLAPMKSGGIPSSFIKW